MMFLESQVKIAVHFRKNFGFFFVHIRELSITMSGT